MPRTIKVLSFVLCISPVLFNPAYARWDTVSLSDTIHSVFTEGDNDSLNITCNTITDTLTIQYLELDNITEIKGRQDCPANLILSTDGEELTKRGKVYFLRHTPEIVALMSEVKNMPATTRKILRGLRDASKSIDVSSQSYLNQETILNATFSPKGSTNSINIFAKNCGIDL